MIDGIESISDAFDSEINLGLMHARGTKIRRRVSVHGSPPDERPRSPNSSAGYGDEAAIKNCINYSSQEQPGHDCYRQCQIEAHHPFEQCEITLELA
jgi:hypothetical protein